MTQTEHPNPNPVRRINKCELNLTKRESGTAVKDTNIEHESKHSLMMECRNMNVNLDTLNKNIEFLTEAVMATETTIDQALGDFNPTKKK